MIPAHRNLAEAHSGALREIKEFDIESEPFDSRHFQNWPANLEAKSFEAALCVPKRKTGRNSNEQIKNATGGFAPPWLVVTDQTPIQTARSKGKIVIVICDRPDHFRSFFKRSGEIRIEKQGNRSLPTALFEQPRPCRGSENFQVDGFQFLRRLSFHEQLSMSRRSSHRSRRSIRSPD